MANNLMFIRCRTCGSILMIGKSYQGGYYTTDDYYGDKTFLEAYNDFLDKHAYCIEDLNQKDINYINKLGTPKFYPVGNYENRFEICYEIKEKEIK